PAAGLDVFGPQPEVRVARVRVAPRVQDRDHGLAGDVFGGEARLLGARAVAEGSEILASEPAVAAQRLRRLSHASFSVRATGVSRAIWVSFNGETYGGIGPAAAVPAASGAWGTTRAGPPPPRRSPRRVDKARHAAAPPPPP